MNSKRIILVFLVLGLLLVGGVITLAQGGNYSLFWTSVDSGGGRLIGSDYSLWGTAGQSDAGKLSNVPYALQGGFVLPAGVPAATLLYLPILTK